MTNGERFQRGVAGGMQYLSACMTVAGGARAAPTKVKCFFRGGCFVAGTQIVTAEGLKNIEDIQAGDMVWSRSDKTGEEGFKRVLAAWETHPPSLVHLYYRRATLTASHATTRAERGDDHYIVGTSNHPFWSETQQAWVELGELHIGEYIRLADGALATVEYTELEWAPEGQTFTTYNFEVADWHTYFVVPEGETDSRVGTWVHNAGSTKYTNKLGRTQYKNKKGQFAKKPGRKKTKEQSANRNTVDDRMTTLYEKYDAEGNFQKHGITYHDNANKRYSKKQLAGGEARRVDRLPRNQAVPEERRRVETNPEPDNNEPWAGWQKPGHPNYRG